MNEKSFMQFMRAFATSSLVANISKKDIRMCMKDLDQIIIWYDEGHNDLAITLQNELLIKIQMQRSVDNFKTIKRNE